MSFSNNQVLKSLVLVQLFLFLVLATEESFDDIDNFIWRGVSNKVAADGKFPWHVVLQKSKDSGLECGGSVIKRDWVLTSANCLRKLTSVYLMLGSIEYNSSKTVHRVSSNLYIHPAYIANRNRFNVGLIKLPEPVDFNTNLSAIKLLPRESENETFANRIAETSGYGVRDDKYPIHYPQRLHYFELNILETRACNRVVNEASNHLCIRGISSSAPHCDGDTGGALVIKQDNGDYIQIGINPFRPEYCNWPTRIGYVHIGGLLDWIEEMTDVGIN